MFQVIRVWRLPPRNAVNLTIVFKPVGLKGFNLIFHLLVIVNAVG